MNKMAKPTMAQRFVFILPLALLLMLFLTGVIRLLAPPPSGSLPPVPDRVPDFAAGELTDEVLAGQVSVLNAFASWCAPCLVEHPLITELADHVPVYGLNFMDEPEDREAWLAAHGDPYTLIGADPQGTSGVDWGLRGLPVTFVIDDDGTVLYRLDGPLTRPILDHEILPLIKEARQ